LKLFFGVLFFDGFHVGEESGEFVSGLDCRETFDWRAIGDEERKDRLSFVLLIRRKKGKEKKKSRRQKRRTSV